MDYCKYPKAPIKTINNLSLHLGVHVNDINKALLIPADSRYKDPSSPAYKKDGTKRLIKSPRDPIRTLQRKINTTLFCHLKWANYLYGSIPKGEKGDVKDYINAAAIHCEGKSVCKLDIADYFNNITEHHVSNLFNDFFRFSEDVSKVLTDIVSYKSNLVQGALTSSYLAMLLFWDLEPQLVTRLKYKGIKYTRLVDDITLSSNVHDFDFSLAIKLVEDMLKAKDLHLNQVKIQSSSISTQLLLVHGLNINNKLPCLPKGELKRIRAAVHSISCVKDEKMRRENWFRKDYEKCLGRVYKLKSFGKNKSFNNLINKLNKVRPLASSKDLKYAKKRVQSLKSDYKKGKKKASFAYRKRYFFAQYKISFLKVEFPQAYLILRSELKKVKP